MNVIELDTSSIDLCFENCECITVDMWAIKSLHFDVVGERWAWDSQHKNFLKTQHCKYFTITLDLSDPRHFYKTPRLVDGDKTVSQIGKECIERLKTSDDLCSFVINGTDYGVPWGDKELPSDLGIPIRINAWQQNSAVINNQGIETLTIKIKIPEGNNGSGTN